jgi:hypothetical protein
MSIEPVIFADGFDLETKFFMEKYNKYETFARKRPISSCAPKKIN